MQYFLEKYKNKILKDEDGESLRMTLESGLDKKLIDNYFDKDDLYPTDLVEMLIYSNGLFFFGIEILSFERILDISEDDFFSFHEWGNGDYDCINNNNEIFFVNHSFDNLELVTNSLEEWFSKVYSEISKKGALSHPMDN